ncbi:MAG: tetratricopeptide repeat protein [Methanothrix sp.]|nr:tetratricopeptide repeat protein [Methanothrix sp.]
MDQLVVLQEIYASLSKGGDGLQKIDSSAIEGSCPELLGKFLDSARNGKIDGDISRKLSQQLQDVYELKRLGDICRRGGLPEEAAIAYNRALSLCRDPVLRPVLQNNLGQAFIHLGDLAKAVFYYKKASDSFSREGDRISLAHVLGNLGSAYRKSGEWDKAIEHCYRSLKTFEEAGDRLGIAQMTGSLGRVYADMGEKELASRYFERSLADFEKLGDKRSSAWVLDQLGRIAGQKMDWDRAVHCFNSSLSLFALQGDSSSQGIVLSNLGLIYLKMGQATAAREPLERAVDLIPGQMKPGYQNALYCLAKTYSALARDKMQDNGLQSSRTFANEASWLFIQAANRYQELASTLGEGRAEVRVAEAIARSQSYLAKAGGPVRVEESLMLLEKAQKSLEIASENADYVVDKSEILNLQRIIAGMKESYRIGLLADEPLMQSRAMNNALDYFMGAVQVCPSEEAGDYLYQALKNINASLDLQRLGRESSEKLQMAAGSLRCAEKHLGAKGPEGQKRSAKRIVRAAEILEESAENGSRPCQEVLLAIASVMASYSLSKIDDVNRMLLWDESLHLLPNSERDEMAVNIKINDLHEPDVQPIMDADLPVLEVSKEGHESRGLILADRCTVPMKCEVACGDYRQLLVPPVGRQFCAREQGISEPEDKSQKPQEEASLGAVDERYQEIKVEEKCEEVREKEDGNAGNNGTNGTDGVNDPDDIADFLQAAKAPEVEKEPEQSDSSLIKAVFLLKIMTVLVVMLLAIEGIIYFI